jgi:hypothetical protein
MDGIGDDSIAAHENGFEKFGGRGCLRLPWVWAGQVFQRSFSLMAPE